MKTNYLHAVAMIASIFMVAPGSVSAATALPTGTIDPVSGFLTTSAAIKHSYTKIGSQYVQVAGGTTAYSANLTVNGVSRRYVVVKPTALTAAAPLLLLLHPNSTSPENMANLTQVADFAVTQGFWAVMPEAINGVWKDDPGSSNSDDVTFISSLVDSLSTQGIDANRVYAAGYSNGGFMSERLACELSDKVAAFGIDAATLHGTQASACAPAKPRSKVYFLGTADNVVPYAGISSGTPNGLWSATDTMNFWVSKQYCGGVLANTLPDRAKDGTTVQQMVYAGCSNNTSAQLYTINNGGHTWPGGPTTKSLGATTQDINATGLIWLFVSAYRK